MAKYQDFLSRVGSNRDRAALRGIFSMFLTDDNPPKFKDLELASIVLSGAETTQITVSGASTTGFLQSGTSTTAYSITGAFTTGISIAADGTTAIAVTSAFTGVTGLSFAGTASGDGILISGACADGIHISGTNTASGLHISGDQVDCILVDVDAAVSRVLQVSVDDGITATVGLQLARTGTTGICTTGIMIDTDGTTALWIGTGFTGTTGILIAGTATNAISITGACTTAINIARETAKTAIRVGEWAGSQAAGSAVVFATNMAGLDTSQLNIVAAFGESVADLTSAYSTSVLRGRHLVSAAADTVFTHEVYGVMGQVVCKNASFNHYASGVMGTFEASNTLTHVMSGYVAAAVTGRLGGAVLTSESGAIVAGVAAINNSTAHTATGIIAGFATHKTAAGIAWPIGLYMGAGSVTQAIRIGNWAGSGAPGSAIAISAATDAGDTSQRNLVACYGESTTDLTAGIHANVGRFRHLVVGSSLQVNHETYGLVGQVVGKSASLLHMHAGLMGTLEANTTELVCNGAYAYSVAAVIARIGGTNLITATKPVAGFSAIHNGAALASGSSIAYAACAVSTGNWTYLLGADNCDNILYVATGTAYECGVKVATQLTGNAYPKMDGVIRMYVGATPYYVPFYAAGNIDNE